MNKYYNIGVAIVILMGVSGLLGFVYLGARSTVGG